VRAPRQGRRSGPVIRRRLRVSTTYLSFPFDLTPDGAVATVDEDQHIRQRLEQILFTSPGERVMVPDFGCGARDLIFEANGPVLAAATEFKIAKALQTYMGTRALINAVNVTNQEEKLIIEIVYTKTRDLQRQTSTFELLPAEVSGGA
jgi:phage baseplate assembly protein W